MNGIIALCHFCELHGPSIVFCTQAYHTHDPQPLLGDGSIMEDKGWNHPRRTTRSSSVGSAQSTEQSTSVPAAVKTSDFCEACRSFLSSQSGYISTDHDAQVRYVSGQHPHHPEVFSMLRQACLRSLSCEVCPGREGPIFFGDENRGNVFSHIFRIPDVHARGLHRTYSIVVVMMDKIFLLNSWPFLVTHVTQIIDAIQKKAQRVYKEEKSKFPTKVQRPTFGVTPENFRLQRGVNTKATRSLVELTNDKQVFQKLHRFFTWILKAGGNRLTEQLLEGPPTEDSIIDLEKSEETDEGFVMVFSRKVSAAAEEEEEDLGGACGGEDPLPDESHVPKFKDLRHLMRVIKLGEFHKIAYNGIIGNQVVIRGKYRSQIKSVIDCLQVLLPKGCCRIVYYSDKYEDSWKCNFLGLAPGTELPKHVDLYITMDIIEPDAADDICARAGDGNVFQNYLFVVDSPKTITEKGPTVLTKIETALRNERLADSVVEQCLICYKEEWMNKVKVLFKFTKAVGNRSEEDTRKLLQVVGATASDKPLLKFWMTGLSVQYRNHMLSSAISQNAM